MGWTATIAVVHGARLEELPSTGGTELGFDEATELLAQPLSAAQIGDAVVLVDPSFGVASRAVVESLGRDAVIVILASTSDTYRIETVGSTSRVRMETARELVEDSGTPIPAEASLAGHDGPEDAHFAVVGSLIDGGIPAVFAARYRPVLDDAFAGV